MLSLSNSYRWCTQYILEIRPPSSCILLSNKLITATPIQIWIKSILEVKSPTSCMILRNKLVTALQPMIRSGSDLYWKLEVWPFTSCIILGYKLVTATHAQIRIRSILGVKPAQSETRVVWSHHM